MKLFLTLTLILAMVHSASGQTRKDTLYNYAYITIEGKGFSKKLKVSVDFGDWPEQIKAGKEFSETLTNKSLMQQY